MEKSPYQMYFKEKKPKINFILSFQKRTMWTNSFFFFFFLSQRIPVGMETAL